MEVRFGIEGEEGKGDDDDDDDESAEPGARNRSSIFCLTDGIGHGGIAERLPDCPGEHALVNCDGAGISYVYGVSSR